MYNEDKYIIDDNQRKKVFDMLKDYKKADMSDIDALKFLKTLLVSAQDFSYKAYDDENTNEINLYDFLSYTLIKHFNDENGGKKQDDLYLETLYTLFSEQEKIEISQSELLSLFENLDHLRITDKLKEYIYNTCYAKHVIRNVKFYNDNQNLNLDINANKYYIDKFYKLEEITNKYNINFYNYENIGKKK